MNAATLALASEAFFTTKGLKGTGLGLSMARGFAEHASGRLKIRSEVGVGTTVTL
jgi:signal transduction histidine kinase